MHLHSLHEEEVFPNGSGIASGRERREVADQSVSDTQISEIDLFALLEFVVEIPGKGGNDLDD